MSIEINQGAKQDLSLLNLPNEVIEHILYQIIKPYISRIKKEI